MTNIKQRTAQGCRIFVRVPQHRISRQRRKTWPLIWLNPSVNSALSKSDMPFNHDKCHYTRIKVKPTGHLLRMRRHTVTHRFSTIDFKHIASYSITTWRHFLLFALSGHFRPATQIQKALMDGPNLVKWSGGSDSVCGWCRELIRLLWHRSGMLARHLTSLMLVTEYVSGARRQELFKNCVRATYLRSLTFCWPCIMQWFLVIFQLDAQIHFNVFIYL